MYLNKEMEMQVKSIKRSLSKYHQRDYHYTMDELDLFIEEFMALQQGATKLTPLEARLLMGQVNISYDISRERKLPGIIVSNRLIFLYVNDWFVIGCFQPSFIILIRFF